MKRFLLILGSVFLITFLSWSNSVFSGELPWQFSKEAAFAKATTENKKIVLLVGRNGCKNCNYMIFKVFESVKPPVKDLLQKKYVLWFANADESKEWYPYARELEEIKLPLICIIDPDGTQKYEDRTTGRQHSPTLYTKLLKYAEKQN